MPLNSENEPLAVSRQRSAIRFWLFALILTLFLTACVGQRGQTLDNIPTLASVDSVEQAATAAVMTQNAPPVGFRDSVSFPEVDDRLLELPGWRYIVTLEFNGVFARTPRETTARARAEVWFNQLGSARRILVETSGELIGQEENAAYEAVKLGPDAFLARDNTCLSNAGSDADTAASLRAGLLVGGVTKATPTGRRATLNGEEAWEYAFTQDALNLPSIRLEDGGKMTANGELWVAPEDNAVVRFYVNLDVENAFIFDRQLPVTGQVILRYDLYDIGVAPNITVPFGC
jgi:hypothetical protein